MAKKKANKDQELICPECKGRGWILDNIEGTSDCFYCYGTGTATDDDSFEHLYHYDDWKGQ